MARFKFRKGCVTFYVYAVRTARARGFARADELRAVIEAVAKLKDFLDHTAMLALPGQRSIDAAAPVGKWEADLSSLILLRQYLDSSCWLEVYSTNLSRVQFLNVTPSFYANLIRIAELLSAIL
ncbi:hypothetical protein TRIUR3_26233 [Triticum urartu]|uniref:DUF7851 domain-containing protein n=2 Tax=Triticum TaxID=4564 RepID=A0A9R0THV4_TRITD|nr:hypothetical protein TRIUR3_26233 [Triticum urartu]VAI13853.1 unnamed protein product [Triticum turgidum subsp. durum]